jgi:hypothetical protein
MERKVTIGSGSVANDVPPAPRRLQGAGRVPDGRGGCRARHYSAPLSRRDVETLFFLDDEDRALIGKRRGDHMRLGFALQLVTVRHLGTFLNDPLDVPTEVLDYVARQLQVADPSCVKLYLARRPTLFEHAEEIKRVLGLNDFGEAEAELAARIDAQAWTTGDGPKAIFLDAIGWLSKAGRAPARGHDAGPAGRPGAG